MLFWTWWRTPGACFLNHMWKGRRLKRIWTLPTHCRRRPPGHWEQLGNSLFPSLPRIPKKQSIKCGMKPTLSPPSSVVTFPSLILITSPPNLAPEATFLWHSSWTTAQDFFFPFCFHGGAQRWKLWGGREKRKKSSKRVHCSNTYLGSKMPPFSLDPVTYRQKLVKFMFFPQFLDKPKLPQSVPILRSDSVLIALQSHHPTLLDISLLVFPALPRLSGEHL